MDKKEYIAEEWIVYKYHVIDQKTGYIVDSFDTWNEARTKAAVLNADAKGENRPEKTDD